MADRSSDDTNVPSSTQHWFSAAMQSVMKVVIGPVGPIPTEPRASPQQESSGQETEPRSSSQEQSSRNVSEQGLVAWFESLYKSAGEDMPSHEESSSNLPKQRFWRQFGSSLGYPNKSGSAAQRTIKAVVEPSIKAAVEPVIPALPREQQHQRSTVLENPGRSDVESKPTEAAQAVAPLELPSSSKGEPIKLTEPAKGFFKTIKGYFKKTDEGSAKIRSQWPPSSKSDMDPSHKTEEKNIVIQNPSIARSESEDSLEKHTREQLDADKEPIGQPISQPIGERKNEILNAKLFSDDSTPSSYSEGSDDVFYD